MVGMSSIELKEYRKRLEDEEKELMNSIHRFILKNHPNIALPDLSFGNIFRLSSDYKPYTLDDFDHYQCMSQEVIKEYQSKYPNNILND